MAGSATFNSEAVAVGRNQTGSFRLYGLFSLSRSMGYLIGQPKKPNEPNKPEELNEPERPDEQARSRGGVRYVWVRRRLITEGAADSEGIGRDQFK